MSNSLRPHESQHARPQASLSITNSRSLFKLMPIESVMPFSHLILYCPLLLLPPIPPSIRVFSNEFTLHMRWPKYWSFSFSISLSNEHPGLISFRMDWLDLLAAQGTLKSLLQHHTSKASILWHSAFFTVQLSHLYMTSRKTIALTGRTFVGKVMSLLFNSHVRSQLRDHPPSLPLRLYFIHAEDVQFPLAHLQRDLASLCDVNHPAEAYYRQQLSQSATGFMLHSPKSVLTQSFIFLCFTKY